MFSLWLGSWLSVICWWSNVAKPRLEWVQVGTGWQKRMNDLYGTFWQNAKERRWVADRRIDGGFSFTNVRLSSIFLWFTLFFFYSFRSLENFICWLFDQTLYTLGELRPYLVRAEHTKKTHTVLLRRTLTSCVGRWGGQTSVIKIDWKKIPTPCVEADSEPCGSVGREIGSIWEKSMEASWRNWGLVCTLPPRDSKWTLIKA